MTVADVREAVEVVRRLAPDGEAAHSAEITLWRAVLNTIAHRGLSADEAATLARAALETQNIRFGRWTA